MIKDFFDNESGAMSLEAAIITAALVALAIAFRTQLKSMWGVTKQKMADMENEIKNG